MKPGKMKPAGFSEGTLDTGGRWKLPSIEDALAASTNTTPLMPLIRCTMPVPCRVCWYCKQAEGRA